MEKKQYFKKSLALILSGILFISSMPFVSLSTSAAAGDGKWDPEPYFSDKAKKEGTTAWFLNDGSLTIRFPEAIGGEKSNLDQTSKPITKYKITISSLGKKNLDTTKLEDEKIQDLCVVTPIVTPVGERNKNLSITSGMVSYTLTPQEFIDNKVSGSPDIPITRDSEYRLNVRIVAIDEKNWHSLPIDALITNVPIFEYSESKYNPIDETNPNALKEIGRFEGNKNTFDNGIENKIINFKAGNPNQISEPKLYDGVGAPYTKKDDPSKVGQPSKAVRFRIDDVVSSNVEFDTVFSREAYDYYGVDEFWFWFDCSDVCLNNVSFRLRANEKNFSLSSNKTHKVKKEWTGYSSWDAHDLMGDTIYSTKGFKYASQDIKDSAPKIKIQESDGGWREVGLSTEGTVTLDHFKGYVRVPVQLFCSEEDTTSFYDNTKLRAGWSNNDKTNVQNVLKLANSNPADKTTAVIIDPAGTCIKDAHLMQRITPRSGNNNGAGSIFTDRIPAIMVDENAWDKPVARQLTYNSTSNKYEDKTPNATYTEKGIEKKGAFKAIEDIYTFGFSFDGCSSESVKHSFFFDNVIAYKNNGKYPEDKILGGKVSPGTAVSDYYDQKLDRASIILETIDKYIDVPSWTNFNEVKYIHSIIESFGKSFKETGTDPNDVFIDNDVTDETKGMAKAAKTLNKSETWKKYRNALQQCIDAGTVLEDKGNITVPSNSNVEDLVPEMIKIMDSLPPADWMVTPNDDQYKQIVKLYQSYVALNRGQLESLGNDHNTIDSKLDQFDTFISYASMLGKTLTMRQDEFVVGQVLAEQPFIPFCDFEKLPEGQKAYRLEDDKAVYTDGSEDTRHKTGFQTYTTSKGNTSGANQVARFSRGVTHGQKFGNSALKIHSVYSKIESNGFMGSKGARVYIDSSNPSDFHNVYMTRDGIDYGSWANSKTRGKCGKDGYNMGPLSQKYSAKNDSEEATEPPLSLIFYADFSELEHVDNFDLVICINSIWGDGGDDTFVPSMGKLTGAHYKYFVLNPEKGEWELNKTTSSNSFVAFETDNPIDLRGFKGYIRIPLYHLKGGTECTEQLDLTSAFLENMYGVRIAVGGSADLAGKSFVIDNVGFTYSQEKYIDAPIENSTASQELKDRKKDKSYEEVYGAKASPAKTFEDAVYELDPFCSTAKFKTDIINCIKLYKGLTDHQRTLPSVINAKDSIMGYKDWAGVTWDGTVNGAVGETASTRPNAVDPFAATGATVQDMEARKMNWGLNTPADTTEPTLTLVSMREHSNNKTYFPDLQNLNLMDTKEKGVPYPGFTDTGEVNYSAIGFTNKEQVDKILLLFEYGFARLSWADQMRFQKGTGLDGKSDQDIWNMTDEAMNIIDNSPDYNHAVEVYNAAVRCRELEKIKVEATAIKDGLVGVYQDYTYTPEGAVSVENPVVTQNNFVTIANKGSVQTVYDQNYSNKSYYAKEATKYGAVYSGMVNSPQGIELFLANTEPNTGLTTLIEEIKGLNTTATNNIASNTNFTDIEISNIKTAIDNYDHLMPKFKNIGELYTQVENLKRKFPVVRLDSASPQVLTVDSTNYKATGTANILYAQALTNKKYFAVLELKDTDTTGLMNDGTKYALNVTIGGTTKNILSDDLVASAKGTHKIELCDNIPLNSAELGISIEAVVNGGNKPTNYEGLAEFDVKIYEKDGSGYILPEKAKNPASASVVSKHFTVKYSTTDTYTVTIPASFDIAWGDVNPKDMGYSVSTSLADGASIDVSVAGADFNGGLTYNKPTADINQTFKNDNLNAGVPYNVTINNWNEVAPGEYSAIFTYTVKYNKSSKTTP